MSIPVRIISSIINYCEAQKYKLFTEPGTFNILYVEGMDVDGELNGDEPNQFNDVRIMLDNKLRLAGNWTATTEPGKYYTEHPMNSDGAARIAFGQYSAWSVGTHGNSEPHRALVQVAPIKVCRDKNQDFSRIDDQLDEGNFGVNQHWGYDLPVDNIGKASAGCLVGRSRAGHRQFMNIVTSDIRYQRDNDFIFTTIIIPGDKLAL